MRYESPILLPAVSGRLDDQSQYFMLLSSCFQFIVAFLAFAAQQVIIRFLVNYGAVKYFDAETVT